MLGIKDEGNISPASLMELMVKDMSEDHLVIPDIAIGIAYLIGSNQKGRVVRMLLLYYS
jgi:hypothetical protein